MSEMQRRDQQYREQPSLFDVPVLPTRDEGKQSKVETYAATLPNHRSQRGIVLARIASAGRNGITRDQLVEELRLPLGSVCGRVRELKDANLVIDTRERRQTSNGATAAVLVCREFLICTNDTKEERELTTSHDAMPDELTCTKTPTDERGEPMQAGRQYQINQIRVVCFEDNGDLFVQRCFPIGTCVPGSRPQSVSELPRGVKVVRLECAI